MFHHVQKQKDPEAVRTVQDIKNTKMKMIVIRIETLNMEVRLLAFFLISVLQKIYTVGKKNSGKTNFSCFLIFSDTLSAL